MSKKKEQSFTVADKINQKIKKAASWQKANPGLSWVNQQHKQSESKIYIPKDMLNSVAYRSLNKVEMLLFQDFLAKRSMKKIGREKWIAENNGNIIFTYSEAKKKGYSPNQFRNGLDGLQARGFLDITHQGKGGRKPLKGDADCTTFWIDDRWEKYGTPEFQPARKPRKKDTRSGRGWGVLMSDPKTKKKILEKRRKKTTTVISNNR